MFAEIDMSAFPPDREESLKKIMRYSRFERMDYRSSLWNHAWRMLWLVEAIAPIAQKHLAIDIEKARVMALVHDDAEIITGDIQAGVKALMTMEETAAMDRGEEDAIRELSNRYPKTVHGYLYSQLLTEMLHKDSIESQFVSYIDKFDAFNESMHEYHAGNVGFLPSIMFYVRSVTEFPYKFPALAAFLADTTSPITYVKNQNNLGLIRADHYADLKPHTKDSLSKTTGFPFYDEWKRIVVTRGGDEGVRWLTEVREYNVMK